MFFTIHSKVNQEHLHVGFHSYNRYKGDIIIPTKILLILFFFEQNYIGNI